MSVYPTGGDVPPTDLPPTGGDVPLTDPSPTGSLSPPPTANFSPPPTGSFPPPPAASWPPPPTGPAPGGFNEVTSDDRMMAMVAHILGIFTSFIGPLVIYLIKKDQSKFVAYHAMQQLALQVVLFIGYIIGGVLAIIGIGVLINTALWIVGLIFTILAGIAANKGEWYEIPLVGKFARQQVGV